MWVTQLQLEMLAAPAQSALLVSRSASKVSVPFCLLAMTSSLNPAPTPLLEAHRAAV